MYIIENNSNHLTALNEAIKQMPGETAESVYCEENWDCFHERVAIPVIPYLNVPQYRGLCPFITDEWLATGVEKLPDNWSWAYTSTGRVFIPNFLILKEKLLRDLISYCEQHDVKSTITELETTVYLTYVYQSHDAILKSFPEIRFEGTFTIVPDNF